MDDVHKMENFHSNGNEPQSEDKSDPSLEEGRQCNPSLPVEMQNDVDTMRGDAIGDTLYSECWVLKIMMKLTKFTPEEWSEDMETDLCLLWDMTIEPDVVEMLVQYNFLEMSSQNIRDCTVPRLTEILVGIIGNMSCIASVRAMIAQNDDIISTLLGLLSIPDAPTLLQLTRLLKACFYDLRVLKEISVSQDSTSQINSITSVLKSLPCCSITSVGDNKHYIDITKDSEHGDECSEEDPARHQTDDSQCEQSCGMDIEYPGSNSCTLNINQSDDKVPRDSHVLNLGKDSSGIDVMNNRTKDETLNLKDEVNKQKNEAESKWVMELCDMNKWLPNIIFILKSSIHQELLRSTLSLLETVHCIPVNNDFLGKYICCPEVVEALMETLNQLRQEYMKDGDLLLKTDYEKAIWQWASILTGFLPYPEGRIALGKHAEAICIFICSHLVVDELKLDFEDESAADAAEFILMSLKIVKSLLKDSRYFYPPIFNCFLSILTLFRETHEKNKENVLDFLNQKILQDVIEHLEKYFEDVVQYADSEALSRVLQHCNRRNVAILQSVMEGHQKKFQRPN